MINIENKQEFNCNLCKYTTNKRNNYNKHLRTKRHKIQKDKLDEDKVQNIQDISNVTDELDLRNICECGKIYKHRQSLYSHRSKCDYIKDIDKVTNNNNDEKGINKDLDMEYKEMMTMLIQENKELRIQMGELIPKIGNNNNSNNNNLIKQKFNINVFLNEECKNALTMDEFIDKIKVTLDNLMITKEKGIAEGVSNIFIENMNKLSLYERPIHCTDTKRETVYIKSKGINWEKDKENKKIKEALEKVSHVQRKGLKKWVEKHPNWEKIPKEQEEYMQLISKCMGNLKDNNSDNKVIKKICNEIYIKENLK